MARKVTIAAGKTNVQLPNGFAYNAGAVVILSDAEFQKIAPSAIPGTVVDNGPVADTGDEVVDAAPTAPAFTSTVAAGATPTKAEFDALRTDVAAIRTALTGAGKPFTA